MNVLYIQFNLTFIYFWLLCIILTNNRQYKIVYYYIIKSIYKYDRLQMFYVQDT